MILIIGKKDRLLMKDACAYIYEAQDKYAWSTVLKEEHKKTLIEDCRKIRRRLFKMLGIDLKYLD